MQSKQKWLLLAALSVIWGSSFMLMKKAMENDMTTYEVALSRILLSSILLLSVGFKHLKGLNTRDWRLIFISGLIGTFIPAFLFCIAIKHTDSAISGILNSMTPINTFIIGLLFFKIGWHHKQLLGLILAFSGGLILTYEGAMANPDQQYGYASLVLLATVMYAFNANLIKNYFQNIPPFTLTVATFVCLGPMSLIGLLTFTSFFQDLNTDSLNGLGYILLLSIFGTSVAKYWFNRLIQITSAVFASSVTYVMPIVAIFWGIIDGETFTIKQGVSVIIILIGVALINSKKKVTQNNL